jgi:hypothetical protein
MFCIEETGSKYSLNYLICTIGFNIVVVAFTSPVPQAFQPPKFSSLKQPFGFSSLRGRAYL